MKVTEWEIYCKLAKIFVEWDKLPSVHEVTIFALGEGIVSRTEKDNLFLVLENSYFE